MRIKKESKRHRTAIEKSMNLLNSLYEDVTAKGYNLSSVVINEYFLRYNHPPVAKDILASIIASKPTIESAEELRQKMVERANENIKKRAERINFQEGKTLFSDEEDSNVTDPYDSLKDYLKGKFAKFFDNVFIYNDIIDDAFDTLYYNLPMDKFLKFLDILNTAYGIHNN